MPKREQKVDIHSASIVATKTPIVHDGKDLAPKETQANLLKN
jgi:hypothetical protein